MATSDAARSPHAPLHRSRSGLSVSFQRTKHSSVVAAAENCAVQRLSLPRVKSFDAQPSNVSGRSTHRRKQEEEERMTEQYERMMDRFHLRRVVLPHSLSSNSQGASTHHRDTLPLVQDLPNAPLGSDGDVAPAEGNQRNNFVTSMGKLGTISPTGPVTIGRIALLSLVVLIQVVFLPLRLTYATIDPSVISWEVPIGVVSDLAFCLNVVLVSNTATYTSCGQLVTTRRAIVRQYRRNGLLLDVLACLPLEGLTTRVTWWYRLCRLAQLALRLAVTYRQQSQFQLLWTKTTADDKLKWLEWLLYSRFGHLVRIGRLVLRVCLLTHYMACGWTLLNLSPDHTGGGVVMGRWGLVIHLHSIYDVLQLLQGQGLETSTVAQDVFASLAVLLGSILLAVMFGHVAILVGNFNANQTAYQHKIESVFAIMDKLQLPQAIRERVHQYYGYLHSEYESLDGEVVKFAKELSHTLELEVVLYKYMDVVMNVPHWSECSPDFQKQLVLNMTVRVYLPDDFIIRCGEVGTSCFIVNRGICKQYQFGEGNDEMPTLPLRHDLDQAATAVDIARPSEMKYYVRDGVSPLDSARSAPESDSSRPRSLTRGHVLGEKALICNYVRTTDVRAFTYVEMCVLERKPFQRMLTRYPDDREMVLTSIVGQCLRQRETQAIECPLLAMVHRVAPTATLDDTVKMLVEAMSPKISDPSIVFGVTDHLEEKLRLQNVRPPVTTAIEQEVPGLSQLPARVEQLQSQLDRIERALKISHDGQASQTLAANTLASGSAPAEAVVVAAEAVAVPAEAVVVHPLPVPLLRRRRGSDTVPRLQSMRRGSDTVPRLQAPKSTHTPYADRLFHTHVKGSTRW